MLLGKNEIPDIFYIFVSKLNPMTYHNLKETGRFLSASMVAIETVDNFKKKYENGTATYAMFGPVDQDCKAISPYALSAINTYWVEYEAEQARLAYFGKFPSRFSSVFAFGDMKTCRKVSNKYKWDLNEVKRFRLLDNPLNRVIKVNMEIISLARYAYKVSNMQHRNELWKNYWNGTGEIEMELPNPDATRQIKKSGLIWEYLIEGQLEVLQEDRN